MKKTDLAIIIPVLNCLDYTKMMIPTIKTKHPYNLILIDNGSTDGTREYFNELAKDRWVRQIPFSENRGVCPSWNFGINFAIKELNSKYFFIPNNDILLHPKTIDLLFEAIKAPRCVLTTAFDVSGMVSQASEVLTMKLPEKDEISDAPDFSCFMLKKDAIDKVGFFDERFFPAYFEDNDYHYRIRLAGLRASKIHRALYFHYGSRTIKEGKDIRIHADLGYAANRDYYKEKWGGKPGEEIYSTPFGKKE